VHVDFEIWWRSAAALLDGENIYRNTGAPASSLNLPLWTVMITPFALFEPLTAYRLFVLMSVAIVVGYLAWITGELSLDARRTALGTAALLLSAPLISTLILGQVYPFLALLRPRQRLHPWRFRQQRYAIYGGLGSDAIYGDDGDDYLYAAGGDGSDPCVVGPEDLAYTSGCEVLYVQ
jgi:hypothetical protein